jgi:hypothetical protein
MVLSVQGGRDGLQRRRLSNVSHDWNPPRAASDMSDSAGGGCLLSAMSLM